MPALESARNAIVGLWRLILYEDRERDSDPWSNPYGRRPNGLVMYHPTGLLSTQLFADRDAPSQAPYVAYIGTFAVREARETAGGFSGVIEHHMEAASPPELLAEDSDRPFVVIRDTLGLGDGRTWRRMFKRLPWMRRVDS